MEGRAPTAKADVREDKARSRSSPSGGTGAQWATQTEESHAPQVTAWLAFLMTQKADPAPQRLDPEGSLPGKPRGRVPSPGGRCWVLTGLPPAVGVRKHPAADGRQDSPTALPPHRAIQGRAQGTRNHGPGSGSGAGRDRLTQDHIHRTVAELPLKDSGQAGAAVAASLGTATPRRAAGPLGCWNLASAGRTPSPSGWAALADFPSPAHPSMRPRLPQQQQLPALLTAAGQEQPVLVSGPRARGQTPTLRHSGQH